MPSLTVELPSQDSLTDQNLARWAEVISDPKLARLEERIETDRFGHIIMSPPPSAHHGSFQFRIGAMLNERLRDGRVITECPLSTADGVKAVDVAWASNHRLEELGRKVCFMHRKSASKFSLPGTRKLSSGKRPHFTLTRAPWRFGTAQNPAAYRFSVLELINRCPILEYAWIFRRK